ncbi:hypothetical protein HYW58_01100 [Candidatus Kaiserbacteria bacterium]|nr:hypothetical protein [Candidatus Kaiserbacteria bacterium]
MKNYMRTLAFPLAVLLFSSIFSLVNAQIVPGLESTLSLRIAPTYPEPGEAVFVTVESFSIDLNRATISWLMNGTLKQQREGGIRFQFTAPLLGSAAAIDVVVQTGSGGTETANVIVRPAAAELLWQAHTYAPPFYHGKRLPSIGSEISVEAIPHFITESGRELLASELLYTWYVDGTIAQEASGKGRKSITVSQSKPVSALSVEALIESPDQSLSHRARVLIPMKNPEVLIYENSPLLGILFHTAVQDTYRLTAKEAKFIAFPFFMSLLNRNDSHITYSWELNNEPIILGDDRGSITVNHSGEGSGVARINAAVTNRRDIFQAGSTEFSIEFSGGSFPGFGL